MNKSKITVSFEIPEGFMKMEFEPDSLSRQLTSNPVATKCEFKMVNEDGSFKTVTIRGLASKVEFNYKLPEILLG